jgi:hypothetical protein
MPLVPCYLNAVVLDEEAEQQTVIVAEREGKRRFPIAIGQMEALAIDRAVKSHVFPRPLTHDLLLAVIDAIPADLTEIRITDLKGGTFFADLVLTRRDASVVEIDCRPSDAIALLVRRPDTAFLVSEDVLAEAGG